MVNEPIPIDSVQIVRSNYDLSERIFNEGVALSYDEDVDTLLVVIGEPKPTISKPFIDGIYIQIEPTTFKIMGCTILSFASDFLSNNKLIRKMFPNALKVLQAPEDTLKLSGENADLAKHLLEHAFSR